MVIGPEECRLTEKSQNLDIHVALHALQVLAQLKKFARTVKSIREAVKPAPSKRSLDSISLSGEESGRPNANMDLSEMLRTDITGLDATVTGELL